jgi:simple sugar transport system permease protein
MKVPSTDVKAYKAIVIIILVVIGSPVIKKWFAKTVARIRNKKSQVPVKGAQ